MRQPNNKKGPEGMAKVNKDVVKRLMSYIGHYKLRFAAVLICIVVNALAMVSCSLYLQTLIDSYITPLLQAATPDFAPLFRSILIMGCIYAVGILACLFYNRTMVSIAQGTLKRIRDEMFEHMQTLPIRYFDTHTHGDIMSHYTNDTDTLRQMLAQSIPQMFSSLITIFYRRSRQNFPCVFCHAFHKLAAYHFCTLLCIYHASSDRPCCRKEWLLFYTSAESSW